MPGFEKLDKWSEIWKEGQQTYFGYPVNQDYDEHFGGELAHVVVMQHVTKAKIDGFIKELVP